MFDTSFTQRDEGDQHATHSRGHRAHSAPRWHYQPDGSDRSGVWQHVGSRGLRTVHGVVGRQDQRWRVGHRHGDGSDGRGVLADRRRRCLPLERCGPGLGADAHLARRPKPKRRGLRRRKPGCCAHERADRLRSGGLGHAGRQWTHPPQRGRRADLARRRRSHDHPRQRRVALGRRAPIRRPVQPRHRPVRLAQAGDHADRGWGSHRVPAYRADRRSRGARAGRHHVHFVRPSEPRRERQDAGRLGRRAGRWTAPHRRCR